MKRERPIGRYTTEEFRQLTEFARPGGWWRRDVLLQALELAYPHWLTAAQIREVCIVLVPKYRDWGNDINRSGRTARSLGRLHSLRLVDRYGSRAGWAPGATGKSGVVLKSPGYRYRLVRDADDLL